MYMITEMLNGRWAGIYQIQDGTNRFELSTRKNAVKNMIEAVRIMNGVNITEADMEFGEEEEKMRMIISNKVFENIVEEMIEALKKNGTKCPLYTNFLYDLVDDVRNFRKTLERISIMKHADDCAWQTGYCHCPVEVAQEALKGDE